MSEKKINQKKLKSICRTKGGSVLSDMSKLAVPFGLIAAKNSLEKFIANRDAEIKKSKSKSEPSSKSKSEPSTKSKSEPSTKSKSEPSSKSKKTKA